MPKQLERFIGVYEIEIVNDSLFYFIFQIHGIDKVRRLHNPPLRTLAMILRFNDIRPLYPRDGEFMGAYIYNLVMSQPRKKLLSK